MTQGLMIDRPAETSPSARPSLDLVLSRIFLGWVTLRTLAWSIVLFLLQASPSLDVIEMLTWGRYWQWGYHKHPPLPAWIAEFAFQVSGGSLFGVYLASYLCVAV